MPTFALTSSGSDNVSGIASYDIEVRDKTTGTAWTALLTQVTSTSTTYPGENGHIYEFRIRARDNAGNVQAWPASISSRTEVATVDFEITNIEVTQSIQDLNNSIVLIAGKRTYAESTSDRCSTAIRGRCGRASSAGGARRSWEHCSATILAV